MDNFRRTLENKSEEFLAATRTPFLSYCYSRDYQSKRFAAFLATSDVDVRADLTLKQTRDCFVPASGHMPSHTQKVTLTEAMATANLNQFLSLLNYACYKHAYKRYGKKVTAISVLQGTQQAGSREGLDLRDCMSSKNRDKRLHNHILLKTPKHLSFDQFENRIRKCWQKTDFGYNECQIEQIRDTKRCLEYNLSSGLDTMDLENTHLS